MFLVEGTNTLVVSMYDHQAYFTLDTDTRLYDFS